MSGSAKLSATPCVSGMQDGLVDLISALFHAYT